MASSLPLDIPPNQQIKPQLLAGHSVLQCQGTSPRLNRTWQCVGSCRVCIMLPVRVTTSDLCGQTPEIISVICGTSGHPVIAAEDCATELSVKINSKWSYLYYRLQYCTSLHHNNFYNPFKSWSMDGIIFNNSVFFIALSLFVTISRFEMGDNIVYILWQ